MLADAAGEIAQVQAQLVERKAEREDVLEHVVRQFPGQTLAPQRGDFRGVAVERGFDLLERRRTLTRGERGAARAQIVGDRLAHAREVWCKPCREYSGQRRDGGPPDDDEIVAQP